FAQVAACRLGARHLGELFARYGVATLESVFDGIIVRTAERMRTAVARIPAGVYSFEDMMDDDGLGTFDIPLKLKVEVGDGRIRFDFTGSSPQVKGNINVTFNATQASVCYALKALLDPDVPNNQAVLDTPEIIAPHGTILNAAFPAAVAARANTCQRIIDLVIGALAPALPEQAVGAANGANTTAVFSGVDPRNGRHYVYLETLGGGFGGRATKDGKDGVQVHITNTSNLPVEAIETEYPLMVHGYGLIEDSGGAGRHRGGLGLRRVISPLDHECIFSGTGERFRHAPWGLFGGTAGATGRFVLTKAGNTVQLEAKPAAVTIAAGDVLTLETPGAGGYGEPGLRSE
ncbi:MAG: hydantoinase B/oxoprolinase family protein, partial [Dongiaceae bacterium]